MKTLDEVIKALEWCIDDSHDDCDGCPYDTGEVTDCHERNIDALHYLRAFRDAKDTLEAEKDRYAEAVRNCEQAENKFRKMEDELNDIRREHIEQMKNPPLTWDELRGMEGKPVWVEDSNDKGEWVLLSGTEDEYLYFVYRDCVEYKIYRDEQGIRWQAYRKERE